MRMSILVAAAILLLPTKGHMSQAIPDYQELRRISDARYVVVARPYIASASKTPNRFDPNFTVEEVLRGAPELKAGDRIRVGQAVNPYHELMCNLQAAGEPMPSPILPSYRRQGHTELGDPEILFLDGADVKAKDFNQTCIGASESVELLDSVRIFVRQSTTGVPPLTAQP